MSKAIYISLDSILDTRLPIFMGIDNNIIDKVDLHKNYQLRKKNVLGWISEDIFSTFYAYRNKEILKFSTVTGIHVYLKDVIDKMVTNHAERDSFTSTNMYINVYPYVLTGDEVTNLLYMVSSYYPNINIEVIYLNPFTEVTTKWIKDNDIATVVMWDGLEWIESQHVLGYTTSYPILGTSLVIPAIANKSILVEDIDTNIFEILIKTLSPIVSCVPISVGFFSTISTTEENTNEETA